MVNTPPEVEQRYRNLLRTCPIPIFVVSGDGRWVDFNEAAVELFGCESPDVLKQLSMRDLCADSSEWDGYVAALAARGAVEDYGMRLRRRDGRIFGAQITAVALEDEEGAGIGYQGTIHDPTKLDRSAHAGFANISGSRLVAETSAEAVWRMDLEGRVTHVSSVGKRVFGYEPEEAAGLDFRTFVSESDWERAAEAFAEVTGGEGQQVLELMAVGKAGVPFPVEVRIAPVFQDGMMVGVQGTARDITERHEAREALRERAEALSALQATVLDITGRHELPTLLRTIVERATQLLAGLAGGMYLCEPEEEQVRCVVSYNTPEDYTGLILKYGEGVGGTVAEKGEPVIIRDYQRWEGRADVFDEQPITAIVSAPMIWRDEVIGVIHVLHDAEARLFTEDDLELLSLFANHAAIAVENARLLQAAQQELAERKEAQEALRQSEERFELFMEHFPAATFIKDAEGCVLHANERFAEVSNCRVEDLIGRTTEEMVSPDLEEQYRRENRRVLEGETIVSETMLPGPGGDTHWITYKFPMYREGEPALVGSASLEITERKRAEKALRASEARMKSIFGAAPIGIGLVSDRVFLDVNERFCEIVGYGKDELVGQSARMVYPSDDEYARVGREKYGQIAEGGAGAVETRFQRKDGTVVDILLSSAAIDAGDLSTGVTFTALDITERKASERALRESEERYRSLINDVLDSSAVGMFILDTDFEVIWTNRAMERYFGLEPGSAVGRDKRQLIHERIEEVFEDPEVFVDTVLATYDDNSYVESFECHVLPGDGREERWLEHRSRPIESGLYAGGRIEHYYDVTERRQAEQALRDSRERLRTLVENMPVLIDAVDEQGAFVLWNRECERVTGYSAEEIVGNPNAMELLYPKPLRLAAVMEEVEGHDADFRDVEWDLACKDGGCRTVRWTNISDQVRIPGFAQWAVGVDVTERREMEEQLRLQERLAAIGQLAGGIAHDFNNILASIMLYAQMPLSEQDLAPHLRHACEIILEESRRAADLVQQILDFARSAMMSTEPLSLPAVVEATFALLRRTIPENIHLATEMTSEPCIVDADATRIHQILMNLALNAKDAMPGGGELRIGVDVLGVGPEEEPPLPEMTPGRWARLTVSDTGIGMTEEVQEHLFEPFFTTKEVGKGTGLGLAQVYGIVKQHQGTIGVETAEGEGTAFTICLPLAEDAEPGRDGASEEAKGAPEGRRPMVLVVEHAEPLRDAISAGLTAHGYDVTTAASGRSALETVALEQVGLILMDVTAPEAGGERLMRQVRQEAPRLSVIALTGHASERETQELRFQGFAGVLGKPFTLEALMEAVRKALGG